MIERFKATWKKLRAARTESPEEALALQLRAARVKETLAPALLDMGNLLGLPASTQRLSQRENLRDMSPMMHERMQQVCFYLSVTTPFAKRIIGIIVDYVVGEGFRPMATDPAVQEVLDRFWNDPVNDMGRNVQAFSQELFVFGELCVPTAVNPVDGFVRLGYIDPQEIAEIEFGRLITPTATEISIAVAARLKAIPTQTEGRQLQIIRTDEDPESETFGHLNGDCFYEAINKAKSASRGISELYALADWVDVFDQMVFDFADRIRFLNAFIWDYTMKGANKEAIDDYKAELRKSPPKQGGVQVHNDQIEIKAQTPSLQGADMSEASRVVKLYGMGGAGLPAWFFADPVDANRATAEEMQGPTGKMLTNKQNTVKRFVARILDYVVDQAIAHGVLPEGVDRSYKVEVPDLSVKDIAATATALQTVVNAAGTAEDRGYIQGETAARAFHMVLTQVGIEVDPDEYEKAQKEKTTREAQQQNDLNDQQNLADALAKAGKPATEMVQ